MEKKCSKYNQIPGNSHVWFHGKHKSFQWLNGHPFDRKFSLRKVECEVDVRKMLISIHLMGFKQTPLHYDILQCIPLTHTHRESDRCYINLYLIDRKGRSFARDRQCNWITRALTHHYPGPHLLLFIYLRIFFLFLFYVFPNVKQIISSHIYEGWNLHFHLHSLYFRFFGCFSIKQRKRKESVIQQIIYNLPLIFIPVFPSCTSAARTRHVPFHNLPPSRRSFSQAKHFELQDHGGYTGK